MEYVNVNLCRIGKLSCFGCCGHNFKSREDISLGIKKNNFEFEDKKSLYEFMNRDENLRDCGICKNLVTLCDGTLGCPGHPKQTKKSVELRKCNILFECKKSFLFRTDWNNAKREKFLEKIKKMDSIEYSIFMSIDADFD